VTRCDDFLLGALALIGTAICGYWDASASAILAGAFALSALRVEARLRFAEKFAARGWVRVWIAFFTAALARNTVISAAAFVAGAMAPVI